MILKPLEMEMLTVVRLLQMEILKFQKRHPLEGSYRKWALAIHLSSTVAI